MRLRPLELARPLVLVALVVSVTTAVARDSASAQPWPATCTHLPSRVIK